MLTLEQFKASIKSQSAEECLKKLRQMANFIKTSSISWGALMGGNIESLADRLEEIEK